MSLHLVFLYRCRARAAYDEFLRQWADVHTPQAAAWPGVRRYVRNIVLSADGQGQGLAWHGAEELWVDDEAAADALPASMPPLADRECVVRLHTQDHVVVPGAPIAKEDVFPKRMTFFRRKPGMGGDESLHYWRHVHGPLAGSVPGVRRYVQSAVVRCGHAAEGRPPFDGVAQLWLDDEGALQRIAASSLFRDRVKPDEANFTAAEATLTLAMREVREVWPAHP